MRTHALLAERARARARGWVRGALIRTQAQECPILEKLPPEMLAYATSFLGVEDAKKARQVCHAFLHAVNYTLPNRALITLCAGFDRSVERRARHVRVPARGALIMVPCEIVRTLELFEDYFYEKLVRFDEFPKLERVRIENAVTETALHNWPTHVRRVEAIFGDTDEAIPCPNVENSYVGLCNSSFLCREDVHRRIHTLEISIDGSFTLHETLPPTLRELIVTAGDKILITSNLDMDRVKLSTIADVSTYGIRAHELNIKCTKEFYALGNTEVESFTLRTCEAKLFKPICASQNLEVSFIRNLESIIGLVQCPDTTIKMSDRIIVQGATFLEE